MKIEINNPMELFYNTQSRELSLKHVESVTGHQVELLFSAQQTRALFDCLVAVADKLGQPLGDETIDGPNLQ